MVSVTVSLNGVVAVKCCYYLASVTDQWMSMENWWNNTEWKTKPNSWENQSEFNCVHHKPDINSPRNFQKMVHHHISTQGHTKCPERWIAGTDSRPCIPPRSSTFCVQSTHVHSCPWAVPAHHKRKEAVDLRHTAANMQWTTAKIWHLQGK